MAPVLVPSLFPVGLSLICLSAVEVYSSGLVFFLSFVIVSTCPLFPAVSHLVISSLIIYSPLFSLTPVFSLLLYFCLSFVQVS